MTHRVHRKGFTLIELLVVIAIIAILAAILFPVFAQAREKARAAGCLSNAKQLGTGAVMYAQDYDETYPGYWQWSPCAIYAHSPYIYPPGWTVAQANTQCQVCPYVKNDQIFQCPSRTRFTNYPPCSYGYSLTMNGGYPMIPGSAYGFPTGANLAQITSPASTIMMADSGSWAGTGSCKADNWDGIYNQACWDQSWYSYPYVYTPLTNVWSAPQPRHQGMATFIFVDGHAKAMRIEATMKPINMWDRNQG